MQESRVVVEQGIVVGNVYDKYQSTNPVVKYLMRRFHRTLFDFVDETAVREVHEVGCGEGFLARQLAQRGLRVRASDFSTQIIHTAQQLTSEAGLEVDYQIRSVYELGDEDRAPLVICCEVLEHLEDPEKALAKLTQIANPHLILSVPKEPIWRLLNMARFRYWTDFGNTPGHIQHWSRKTFTRLVERYVDIDEVRSVTPWTFLRGRSR